MMKKFLLWLAPPKGLVLTLSLALLTAILRTAALLLDYDAALGYFLSPAARISVSLGFALTLISAALTGMALPDTKNVLRSVPPRCASLFLVALLLVCGVMTLSVGAISAIKLDVFSGIFIIISALFFCIRRVTIRRRDPRPSAVASWGWIAAIAALLLQLASAYFDMTVTINGPLTPPYLFALLASALFFLYRLRGYIGRPAPRLTCALALSAMGLTLPVGLGNLALIFFGDVGGGRTAAELSRPLLLLAVFLYIIFSLLPPPKGASDEATGATLESDK